MTQIESLKLKSRQLGPALFDDYSNTWNVVSGAKSPFGQFAPLPFTGRLDQPVTSGYQLTWSQGHPWPPRKGQNGDVGGPFRTFKSWFSSEPWGEPRGSKNLFPRDSAWSAGDILYSIQHKPTNIASLSQSPNTTFSELGILSEAQLLAKGTLAIERCKPTRGANQLLVALTELKRDGMPLVPGHGFTEIWRDFRRKFGTGVVNDPRKYINALARFVREDSSEFLNLAFGWMPLISDTQKLLDSYQKLPQIWDQYQRDAGRRVRRSFAFPTEKTTEVSGLQGTTSDPVASSFCYFGSGQRRLTQVVTRDLSFKGAFRYYLPGKQENTPLAELYRFAQYADKVYGLTPTPDNVWNLIPWTWAADWFSNLGSVISNLSDWATKGLVLDYGYVIERYRRLRQFNADFGWYSTRVGPTQIHLEMYQNVQVLTRLQATPFGFGLNWEGFTPFQLAILAALQISRR